MSWKMLEVIARNIIANWSFTFETMQTRYEFTKKAIEVKKIGIIMVTIIIDDFTVIQ